jgi:hypothetical protein
MRRHEVSEQRLISAEEICRQTYKEAEKFYKNISSRLPDDVGFQILYGPPYPKAPILFLGYQPGRGCKTPLEERAYGSERRWPPRSEYATECWPLARRLRDMLGTECIERCVGLNAIFIRADSIEIYRRDFDRTLRDEIKAFCLPLVVKMVKAIQPGTIVAIGLETLELFGGGKPCRKGTNGDRVLTRTGTIAGCNALGVLHLSGARISRQDRETIATDIRTFCISN